MSKRLYGVRGATGAENTAGSVTKNVCQMCLEILKRNSIKTEDIVSVQFTHTMEQDAFAKKNGGEYFIRSLYFDDRDDSAFREKLDGIDERDKFRIRIYNMRDDVIKLECRAIMKTFLLHSIGNAVLIDSD